VTVGGFDMLENPIPAKKLIGYLPENAPAYTDMTVYGFLDFAAAMRGLRGEAKKSAIQRAVSLCFLQSVLHQNVDTLSKGYRHRTCFAQSIIHDPEVLVLDEPTDGLDPNQKHEIRQLIRQMGGKKAIIFSTHILEEVDAVCTRALIIDRGVVVANGSPQELRQKSELAGAVTVRVRGVSAGELTARLQAAPGVGKVTVLESGPGGVTVRAFAKAGAANGALAPVIGEAVKGWALEQLRTEEGRLDEVFRGITLPDTGKEAKV
jgi:ABC-2 type transport system ATP-binding protein